MTETDVKERNARWFEQHELTEDELERLIENKFIRAREYHQALKERESRRLAD